MNIRSQHGMVMWMADFIGAMMGGAIVTIWVSIVIYYGTGLGGLLCR